MYRRPLVWISCLSLGALAAGCAPQGECQAYNDCPAPQYCSDGTCVDGDEVGGNPPVVPSPQDRDAGPAGEGVLSEVRTTFGVPWLMRHPSDANLLLFPEQQVVGGSVTVDTMRVLDLTEGRVRSQTFLDLTTMSSGACLTDQIWFAPVDGEDWYHCLSGPRFRIIYDGKLDQPSGNTNGVGAQLLHTLAPLAGDFGRVLAASRGGALTSFQLGAGGDQVGADRVTDTFNVNASSVVGIYPLEGGNVAGDHLLVHNRSGAAGSLVPMTRDKNAEYWYATPDLDVVTLDDAVHAVWVIGAIHVSGNTTTPNDPNYLVVEPSTGYVRYFRYETNNAEIVPATQFETNAIFLADAPAATERLLLEPSPSGQYLFYTHKNARKIWRLPLVPGGEDLVRQIEIDDFTREITSIMPVSDDTTWVSFGNENLVQKVRLVPSL